MRGNAKGKTRAKAAGKAKPKAKGKAKAKVALREQSKNKKLMELWHELLGSLQKHFNGLGRDDKTDFVHAGVRREGHRLSLDHAAMFQMKAKREEQQKGEEK